MDYIWNVKKYFLELLTSETIKLLRSTMSKNKNENGENVSHLEITEEVLVHCKILTMIINMIQESCMHLLPINILVS